MLTGMHVWLRTGKLTGHCCLSWPLLLAPAYAESVRHCTADRCKSIQRTLAPLLLQAMCAACSKLGMLATGLITLRRQ